MTHMGNNHHIHGFHQQKNSPVLHARQMRQFAWAKELKTEGFLRI